MFQAVRHHDDVEVAADLLVDHELVLWIGAACARDRFHGEILADDRTAREGLLQDIDAVAERATPIEDRERLAAEMAALRRRKRGDDARHEVARLSRSVVALPLADPELVVEEGARIDVIGEQDGHC